MPPDNNLAVIRPTEGGQLSALYHHSLKYAEVRIPLEPILLIHPYGDLAEELRLVLLRRAPHAKLREPDGLSGDRVRLAHVLLEVLNAPRWVVPVDRHEVDLARSVAFREELLQPVQSLVRAAAVGDCRRPQRGGPGVRIHVRDVCLCGRRGAHVRLRGEVGLVEAAEMLAC